MLLNFGFGEKEKQNKATLQERNKPVRAVSLCIEHVTYMERQRDKQTDETTRVVKEAFKTCLSII